MNVVRMNMRNCGDTEKLTSTLYHSGLSGDVAQCRTLIEQDSYSISPLWVIPWRQLVLKLAGEWGSAPPRELKAVAAVSPAADLAACADAIHELKSNRMYEWKSWAA